MVSIQCETIKPFSKYQKPDSILIFGRIAKIRSSAPENYILQCNAIDKNGNSYNLYTDYDACLVCSDAIAVPVLERR